MKINLILSMMKNEWEKEMESNLKRHLLNNKGSNFEDFNIKNYPNYLPDISKIRIDVSFNFDTEEIDNDINNEAFEQYMSKNSKIWSEDKINDYVRSSAIDETQRFFDIDGSEKNALSSSTYFSITGENNHWIVWAEYSHPNSESWQFETEKEALIFVAEECAKL